MTDRTHPDSGRTTSPCGAAIPRYKIGYHADEWGQRSSTPSGIPDASGSWVHYADHLAALAAGQATAAPTQEPYSGISPLEARAMLAAASHGQAPADSVQEDAARYRYLRDVPMECWPAELLTAIRLQQNAKWDAAIDAARAVQEKT